MTISLATSRGYAEGSRPGYGASTPRSDGATTATVAEDAAAFAGPEALTEHLEQHWSAVFAVTAAKVAASFGTLTPPVDRAALRGAGRR